MKFVTTDGTRFEVSNLTRIVINDAALTMKNKDKNGPARIAGKNHLAGSPTRVWAKTVTNKGVRWLKYRYFGRIPDNEIGGKPEAGASPAEMRDMVQDAMKQEGMRVWFSGDTCNIERIINYAIIQQAIKAQNEPAKKPRRKMIPSSQPGTGLNEAVQQMILHAAQRAGAQVTGPIMIVAGQRGGKSHAIKLR